ncbi:MAG: hypothetical protein U1F24_08530 [Alphaproteobacteria bacterium]
MFSRIAAANERLQESFDGLAYLPLAFAAVLGFFVLATALLEDPAGSLALSHVSRFAG